jgi:hypothetical protein
MFLKIQGLALIFMRSDLAEYRVQIREALARRLCLDNHAFR